MMTKHSRNYLFVRYSLVENSERFDYGLDLELQQSWPGNAERNTNQQIVASRPDFVEMKRS